MNQFNATPWDDPVDDLMEPEAAHRRELRIMNRLARLRDADLELIASNHDHPASELADKELEARAACREDSRVGQAMGFNHWETPS